MTETLKYRAKIKAKGLDSTGVTEDHAQHMAANLGQRSLMIVEVLHDTLTTDTEGRQLVTLKAELVELVPDEQEETVRDFMRAIYKSHPAVQGQDVLKGTDPGPTVTQAAEGLKLVTETLGDPEAPLGDAPAGDPWGDGYPEGAPDSSDG